MREMKDSGINWIGLIPSNWEVTRIKYVADKSVANSFIDGDWIESSVISDEGIRYYTTGNIGDGVFKEQGNGYISEETFHRLNCKYAFPGDIVIARLNEPFGRSCILPNVEEKYVLAVDIVILRPNALFDKRYICYISQCDGYHSSVGDKSRGTAMKRISRSNLGDISIIQPPADMQAKISDTLDYYCKKVDALIANQQAQIEKLKQYRQSLITEVVTKGLDPNAPMKDSGVDEIGVIPYSYDIRKLLFCLEMPITDGPHTTPELYPDGIPFVSAEAVSCGNGSIDFNHIRGYVSKEFYDECCLKYIPKLDDIYMIKSGATTGRVSIVDTDRVFTIWSPLAVMRSNKATVLPRYLFYFLQSAGFQRQVELGWSYGTQQNIGMRTLEKLKVVVPPLEIQQSLIVFLDNSLTKVAELISIKQRKIDALNKYKQTLIYEYVTGKKEVE